MLFTLNLQNAVSDPGTHVLIKACSTARGGPRMTTGEFIGAQAQAARSRASGVQQNQTIVARQGPSAAANLTAASSCGAVSKKAAATAQLAWSGSPSGLAGGNASVAATELARYFRDSAVCGSAVMFAYAGDAVIGAVAGADLVKSSAADLVDQAKAQLDSHVPGQLALEVCQRISNHPSISSQFGFFADLHGNISAVLGALRTWADGGCLDLADMASRGHKSIDSDVSVLTSPFDDKAVSARTAVSSLLSGLQPRADCRVIQVVSGDSCGSLASRCGISGNDFMKYNSYNSNLCSTLMPKQYVCCSAGSLPDMRPKPNADGRCYTYKVRSQDGCWAIGDNFGITQDAIEQFNKQTWGWAGCAALKEAQIICLSSGLPPMPAQDLSMNWYVLRIIIRYTNHKSC
jgi:hypothetical protein